MAPQPSRQCHDGPISLQAEQHRTAQVVGGRAVDDQQVGAQLAFHVRVGSYDTDGLIEVL